MIALQNGSSKEQRRKRYRIALVLKGYPRLSETFIAQEILELERAGFDLSIISLRHPYDPTTHPVHAEIRAPVHYLPEYMHDAPSRVWQAWRKARKMPGYGKALRVFLNDLRRDRTRNRLRRFGQAMVMASEWGMDHDLYYVHFLHTPASVARYASMMTGKPFAISAHARDIWTSPDWEITEKLDDCQWLVTCTEGGWRHLQGLSNQPDKVHLVYHGIDLSRFPVIPTAQENANMANQPVANRDGADPQNPVRLVTVGRAVAKKGLDTLIDSFALLPSDLSWTWTHIGGGALREALKEQAVAVGIDHRCNFLGARPQSDVLEAYRNSDLFVMPCRIDDTGDRDGLPNVFVEAQSQGVPIVSTPISGIPELIENDVNGVLVEPDDVNDLAAKLTALCRDPETRRKMGRLGQQKVATRFDHLSTIGDLVNLLDDTLGHIENPSAEINAEANGKSDLMDDNVSEHHS